LVLNAHGVLRAVDELVPAALASQEGDDLSFLRLPPSIQRAHTWLAVEHDDKLFLREVVVVEIGHFARRQLPEAQPEAVAAGLAAQAGALTSEAGLVRGRLLRAFESTELETDSERWLGRFAPPAAILLTCS